MDIWQTIGFGLTALVAVEHVYILILEMFLWTRPAAMRTFGTTREFAEATKALAGNQGLYNGFLAAGLGWGLLHPDRGAGHDIQVFFLVCIVVAAVYGGVTAKKSILWKQGLPAALALGAVLIAGVWK